MAHAEFGPQSWRIDQTKILPVGGRNAEVLNRTVHKYFPQLNITNTDPTKQATPYEFKYNSVMDQCNFGLYHKMERLQFEAYKYM